MAVATNADAYAVPRQNIFFKTTYPSLEGQCVTLTKCFMEDMSGVPNPHAARGDARYVGKTLVAQGHAVEVPFAKRQRGDLICYEFGTYGHIAVQLSGQGVFEQNVNLGGVQSKIVDGERVYASRIGNENEAWRVGKNPHAYRLNTYREDSMIDANSTNLLRIVHSEVGGWDFEKTHKGEYDKIFHAAWDGKDEDVFVYAQWQDKNAQITRALKYDAFYNYPQAKKEIVTLTASVADKQKTIEAQQKEIESLKAQVGDNSKWETFKALIRELIGSN